jgi:hypothetical protein
LSVHQSGEIDNKVVREQVESFFNACLRTIFVSDALVYPGGITMLRQILFVILLAVLLTACNLSTDGNQTSQETVVPSLLQTKTIATPLPVVVSTQTPTTDLCPSAFQAGTWVMVNPNPIDGENPQYYLRYAHPQYQSLQFESLYSLEYGHLYLLKQAGCEGGVPLWEVEDEMSGFRGYFPERDARNGHIFFEVEDLPSREFYFQYPGMLALPWYCLLDGHSTVGEAAINPVDGQWWCANMSSRSGPYWFEPVNMDDSCSFIYGKVGGQAIRPKAVQADPNDPGSWECPLTVDEMRFVGADEPFSITYLRVPAPVAPHVISVYQQPDDGSQVIGYLEPLRYYEYIVIQQSSYWLQVRNPYGQTGWIDLRQSANLVTVGNLRQSMDTELTVDQIFEQTKVATLTTVAQLEPELQQSLQMAMHQENLQFLVSTSEVVAIVVEYIETGQVAIVDLICVPVSLLNTDNTTVSNVDYACVAFGALVSKSLFAWASVTANPRRYIDSWYVPFRTEILDRTSGACLFAKYFVPGGGGERCEGMNEYDLWD